MDKILIWKFEDLKKQAKPSGVPEKKIIQDRSR